MPLKKLSEIEEKLQKDYINTEVSLLWKSL